MPSFLAYSRSSWVLQILQIIRGLLVVYLYLLFTYRINNVVSQKSYHVNTNIIFSVTSVCRFTVVVKHFSAERYSILRHIVMMWDILWLDPLCRHDGKNVMMMRHEDSGSHWLRSTAVESINQELLSTAGSNITLTDFNRRGERLILIYSSLYHLLIFRTIC